jgi:serine/threonine-protein kinase
MNPVRYRPLGPLLAGEGSRAYLGLALAEGLPPRPVVMVWAPPEVIRNPELNAQLERETQRAVVLDHPNILRVHGLTRQESGVARITEFADGESLRRLLEVRPLIPAPFAALIAADVAMGVHYAHLAGNDDGSAYVHGDLRPETVMVSFSGVCKVTGYGALGVAPREREGRRVRNRRIYSAPEQLLGGREAVTVRTDVFLLGLLLYECLTGRMPFQGDPDVDKALLERELPPLPDDVPAALEDVVRQATARRAQDRHPSALAFREAIIAASEGLPSAETFSEFLGQIFPPDRDARASRRQMLELGTSDIRRSPPPAAALPPAPHPSTTKTLELPATEVPPQPTYPTSELEILEVKEHAEVVEEALDAALEEVAAQNVRPGVARPRPGGKKPKKTKKKAPPAPEEELVAPPTRPRWSTLAALLAIALITGAAIGALLAPGARQRLDALLPQGLMASAPIPVPPPTTPLPSPVPEPAPATAAAVPASAAPEAAGTQENPTAQPAPESAPPSATSVALARGTLPAESAGGAVVPAAGALPAAEVKPPPPPEPPPPPVTTRLQLTVQPPVEVSLEGKPLGTTPLDVVLAPGTYTLSLDNPAKGIHKRHTLTVGPEGTTQQNVRLNKGWVIVRAPPGTRLFLNERKAGKKLALYEGEYVLVATARGQRWEKPFTVEAGQRQVVDMRRPPQP